MGKVEQRLSELGIKLPTPGTPAGNYMPFVVVGDLVFMAGQVNRSEGRINPAGKLGADLTVEQGQSAARICATNLLAQLRAACDGNLDRVVRCVRLGGFVNCDPKFHEHPKVLNGASDLMIEVFGERGRHARTAVGVSSLPSNAACEVEAVFQIK